MWLHRTDENIVRGIACDDKIDLIRVPGYIWPKGSPLESRNGLFGLWIHGGGYLVGSGSESYPESGIYEQLVPSSLILTRELL
jgi:hypothetical protein